MAPRSPSPASVQASKGSSGIVMVGTLLLLAAIAAMGMMVAKHFWRIDLPGCGAGSACDQAAASRWGTVPLLNLPTSFLGLAYFLALLIAWTGSHGSVNATMRWVLRFGVLASLFFLAVLAIEKLACPYCLAAHLCNIAFLILVEAKSPRTTPSRPKPAVIGAAVGVVALAALGIIEHKARAEARSRAERELAESTRLVTDRPATTTAPAANPWPSSTDSSKPNTTPQQTPPPSPAPAVSGFSGRYAWGPDKAAVRVVMYTDYQCPDCKILESQLRPFLDNPNVAVLIKHFPFSSACNPRVPNLHPNACWAARAAHAAGMMQGTPGFWKMHHWLFDQGGSFTDASLPPALTQLGFDAAQFQQIMQSQETLARVQADISEAWDRGLMRTPMIFINGVELKGWTAPNALTRTLQAVLASNLEPDTFANDPMPSALDKYMTDWSESPQRTIPAEITRRALGPADAPVSVVVFGDYMEPGTQEADALLRLYAAGADSRIRYSFAHFPVNKNCNPATGVTKFESCQAAQLAEAAEAMLGTDGFWRAHDWLMVNKGVVNETTLNAAAGVLAVDAPALMTAMQNPSITAAIQSHARTAQSLGIQGIPFIFINGRHVPRFKLDNEVLLPRMIDQAASQSR